MSTLPPKLRPGLAAARDEQDPIAIYLFDQLEVVPPLRLTELEFTWVRFIDGKRSLTEIHTEVIRSLNGLVVPFHTIQRLIDKLQQGRLLHGPDREPSCIGSYHDNPDRLRSQLRQLFVAPGGPGLPGELGCRIGSEGSLRALLVPHMDYGRGGVTYGWGFKELFERTDARLFVIVGTCHVPYHHTRFKLTRQNFKSPFGIVPTDQQMIDKLVAYYGEELLEDDLSHIREHSIELEVVLLQYLYEKKRDFRIVPMIVSSFHDCVEEGREPKEQEDISRIIEVLRRLERETKEPICYIISGDLAHIGPFFDQNDPPVNESILEESRRQDQAIIQQAESADASHYFRVIEAEKDARRICGLPPTYVVLEAAQPRKGKLLHYSQYVHPRGEQSVSFAAMGFE